MNPVYDLDGLEARGLREPFEAIARRHHVTLDQILSSQRGRAYIANARHEVAHYLVVTMGLSYPAVGDILGRDHSTIMASVDKHCELNPGAERPLRKVTRATIGHQPLAILPGLASGDPSAPRALRAV